MLLQLTLIVSNTDITGQKCKVSYNLTSVGAVGAESQEAHCILDTAGEMRATLSLPYPSLIRKRYPL